MFGNAPRLVWEKWLNPDQLGRIELACRCLLIEVDGMRILCETGIGAFFEPKLAERYGIQTPEIHVLLKSLEQIGLKDSDIDVVILSHLHFDHAGGLLTAYDKDHPTSLLFPKARFLVGKDALERALHPHPRDRASFIPGLMDKLESSGRLTVVTGSSVPDLFPDRLEFLFTHGHTPGHMHVKFKGSHQSVFFCGDLVPGLPWLHLPITMGYDRFPEKLIDEKSEIYGKAVQEKWLLFFTHDPEWSMSTVKEVGGKFVADVRFDDSLLRMEI